MLLYTKLILKQAFLPFDNSGICIIKKATNFKNFKFVAFLLLNICYFISRIR
jgi:hypothetical protein